MKRPKHIALTNSERVLLAGKVRLIEQGEQARLDAVALVACIVERAGGKIGEYLISADTTALTLNLPPE